MNSDAPQGQKCAWPQAAEIFKLQEPLSLHLQDGAGGSWGIKQGDLGKRSQLAKHQH